MLITLDTTRADVVGCYGGAKAATPRLDALAAEGITFDAAYTVTPVTLPAHASMLTGLYPTRHGIRANGLRALPRSATTLAELASEAGHQTAAFIAAVVLDPTFGLDQGFHRYDAPARQGESTSSHIHARPADEVISAAVDWIRGRDRDQPFFVWVHLFDPHGPYAPPPEFHFGDSARAAYLGEVAFADREVGRFLDALRDEDAMDRTTVLVVADHGEAFGEHGEHTHGMYCYEPTLKVPMILRLPGAARGGERRPEPVSVVDVYPTLARSMGLEPPGGLDGIDVGPPAPSDDRGIYLESYTGFISYGWSPLAGWIDSRGKYLHGAEPELYDPRSDPREETNLASERPDELRRYREEIIRLTARPPLPQDEETGGADEELLQALRDIGYAVVGGSDEELPHPLDLGDRASPSGMVEAYADLLRAQEMNNQGRWEESEIVFRRVLAEDPDNYFALDRLAQNLMSQNRPQEAVVYYRHLLRDGPQWAPSHFNLGLCLQAEGDVDGAIEHMARAVAIRPGQANFFEALVELLEAEGRTEEAETYRRLRAEGR